MVLMDYGVILNSFEKKIELVKYKGEMLQKS
jgi:hypothetical protein